MSAPSVREGLRPLLVSVTTMEKTENVSVTVHGNVRTAEFSEESNICVKMIVVASGDWKVINGENVVLSCFSYRGELNQIFIDLPFEFGVTGTSPFMWPKLVLNCFSKDASGKDSVVGYGVLAIPSEPGTHSCRVHCFLPETSSILQQIIAKMRGVNAEFVDPLLPAHSEERYACRTSCKGFVDMEINVNIKTTETGYKFSPQSSVSNGLKMIANVPSSIMDLTGVSESMNKDLLSAISEHQELGNM